MIPRTGREHLVPFRQHIDRAGGVRHDLLGQPVLERRDHPIIAIVDDQERVPRLVLLLDHHLSNEIRLLNPERVMGRRAAAIAATPAIVSAPGRSPVPSTGSSGRRIRRSLCLPRNIVTPSSQDSPGADYASGARKSGSPCGMPQPMSPEQGEKTWRQAGSNLKVFRLPRRSFGHGRSAHAKMATDE